MSVDFIKNNIVLLMVLLGQTVSLAQNQNIGDVIKPTRTEIIVQ